MSPAPVPAALADVVAESHTQWVTLEYSTNRGSTWAPLDLIDGTVTWQERRAPRVLADLVAAFPDQATVDALDPRRYVEGRLVAHYVMPDGSTQDLAPVRLHLRQRGSAQPDGNMRLVFASSEALWLDGSSVPLVDGPANYDPPLAFLDPVGTIRNYLRDSMAPGEPGSTVTVSADVIRPNLYVAENTTVDTWQWLQDLADACEVDIFDNGDKVLRIAARPVRPGLVDAAAFSEGVNSTLLESDSVVSREEFANSVYVRYRYASKNASTGDTYTQSVYGMASIASGPYSPAQAGYRFVMETKEGRVDQGTANQAARVLLAQLLSRSRSLQFHAVPQWWLRPGDTVTVQVVGGQAVRQFVSELGFDIADRRMTIRTRLPDTTTAITEGA